MQLATGLLRRGEADEASMQKIAEAQASSSCLATTVKIFGERNTSTNALKRLIHQNSEARVALAAAKRRDPRLAARLALAKKLRLPPGIRERIIDSGFVDCSPLEAWKHCATYFDDAQAFAECHVIFCVRHPASWILGLYRRPYHISGPRPPNVYAFLNKRWKTVGRERLGRAETTATALYNLKMAAFTDLQSRLTEVGVPYSVVRHEDFAVDQAAVFARLAPHLSRPSPEFTPLEASTKDPAKTRDYYKEYYGNQRWYDEIDTESRARIRDEIDWSAVADLGYSPI